MYYLYGLNIKSEWLNIFSSICVTWPRPSKSHPYSMRVLMLLQSNKEAIEYKTKMCPPLVQLSKYNIWNRAGGTGCITWGLEAWNRACISIRNVPPPQWRIQSTFNFASMIFIGCGHFRWVCLMFSPVVVQWCKFATCTPCPVNAQQISLWSLYWVLLKGTRTFSTNRMFLLLLISRQYLKQHNFFFLLKIIVSKSFLRLIYLKQEE